MRVILTPQKNLIKLKSNMLLSYNDKPMGEVVMHGSIPSIVVNRNNPINVMKKDFNSLKYPVDLIDEFACFESWIVIRLKDCAVKVLAREGEKNGSDYVYASNKFSYTQINS